MLAYWAASVGVTPTPAYLAKVSRDAAGERYPCQGGRCACASARECWTACRCKTGAQKVAWALREGVAIPAYAELDLAAAEPEPAAPACPLCIHDDKAQAPAAGRTAERAPAVTLSPLGCKGLEVLTAIAVATSERPRALAQIPETPRALAPASDAGWVVCARMLEIEPPPPRAPAV